MKKLPDQRFLSRSLNKKITEKSFIARIGIINSLLDNKEIKDGGVVLKRHYDAGNTLYPIFVKITMEDYINLQNVLLDIDPNRVWTMRQFIKLMIKWFIDYYSGETENLPFKKLKKKFLTKEIRKFNEMFAEFID